MSDLLGHSSAVISDCGTWRWRLDRTVATAGLVFAYFGVNGSTATGEEDDATVRKWNGFTIRNGGARYITGNAFGFRATDVRELARCADPVGPENDFYLAQIISEADVLVPCWGNQSKVPERLRPRFSAVRRMIFAAGKPVKVFGLTQSGDPKHPLMLGYDTPLLDWQPEITKTTN